MSTEDQITLKEASLPFEFYISKDNRCNFTTKPILMPYWPSLGGLEATALAGGGSIFLSTLTLWIVFYSVQIRYLNKKCRIELGVLAFASAATKYKLLHIDE